jgi:hypothetical protein
MLHAKNKNGKVSYSMLWKEKTLWMSSYKIGHNVHRKDIDVRINEMVLRCHEAVEISYVKIIRG